MDKHSCNDCYAANTDIILIKLQLSLFSDNVVLQLTLHDFKHNLSMHS